MEARVACAQRECVYDVRVAEIALVNSKRVALIDDADLPLVSKYTWYLLKSGPYAYANVNRRGIVLMHRMLMRPRKGRQVDHRNGIGLDNRRSNIRTCTHAQNQMNRKAARKSSSRLKGVTFRPNSRSPNKYAARGRALGEIFHLGNYATAIAAHRAYCAWARKAHGAFFRAS